VNVPTRKLVPLLHVSYDPVTNFELRVPKYRLDEEDCITKRICPAPDIESAINAKPGRASAIEAAIRLKIPICLFVYTAMVPREKLIFPGRLATDYGVKDAFLTQEHWALEVPDFVEHIYMVDEADFELYDNGMSPRLNHLYYHEIDSLPEKCAQRYASEASTKLGLTYSTDLILTILGEKLNSKV